MPEETTLNTTDESTDPTGFELDPNNNYHRMWENVKVLTLTEINGWLKYLDNYYDGDPTMLFDGLPVLTHKFHEALLHMKEEKENAMPTTTICCAVVIDEDTRLPRHCKVTSNITSVSQVLVRGGQAVMDVDSRNFAGGFMRTVTLCKRHLNKIQSGKILDVMLPKENTMEEFNPHRSVDELMGHSEANHEKAVTDSLPDEQCQDDDLPRYTIQQVVKAMEGNRFDTVRVDGPDGAHFLHIERCECCGGENAEMVHEWKEEMKGEPGQSRDFDLCNNHTSKVTRRPNQHALKAHLAKRRVTRTPAVDNGIACSHCSYWKDGKKVVVHHATVDEVKACAMGHYEKAED